MYHNHFCQSLHWNAKTSWYNKRGSWLWNVLRIHLMYVHRIWIIISYFLWNLRCLFMCLPIVMTNLNISGNSERENNGVHLALYNCYVLDIRSIPNPGQPEHYWEEFFLAIKTVKNEGLLNVTTLRLGLWCKDLLEILLLPRWMKMVSVLRKDVRLSKHTHM